MASPTEARKHAVQKSIDERLARIEAKLGIVTESEPDAEAEPDAPTPAVEPVPVAVQPTKPPAFKPVTK